MPPIEIIIQTIDDMGYPVRVRMEFPDVDNDTLLLTCARQAAMEFCRVRLDQGNT